MPSLITSVEIDIYEPIPDKPGYVRPVRRITKGQFMAQVKANLEALGLDNWEWISCQMQGEAKLVPSSDIHVGLRRGNESPMIEVTAEGEACLTIKHFGEMSELLQIIEAIYCMVFDCESQLSRRYPAPEVHSTDAIAA